jgi:hypothetical protein
MDQKGVFRVRAIRKSGRKSFFAYDGRGFRSEKLGFDAINGDFVV